MGCSESRMPRLEVIIDTGRLGEAKAIRGDHVDFVCKEAEAIVRLVIESGLSFCLEVNAPDLEHDQIHTYLLQVAANLGLKGEPWTNQFGSDDKTGETTTPRIDETFGFDERAGIKLPSQARTSRRLHN